MLFKSDLYINEVATTVTCSYNGEKEHQIIIITIKKQQNKIIVLFFLFFFTAQNTVVGVVVKRVNIITERTGAC